MTFQNSILIELLNDDSFVTWVKGDKKLPVLEKQKWDDWLNESSDHATIVQKAEKVIAMPFNVKKVDCGKSGELKRLLEALENEETSNSNIV